MSIPYANRTATVTIPALALVDKPRLKQNCSDFINEISEQWPIVWRAFFEGFVWLSNEKIRVTFCSPNHMEDIINQGISFRGHPVEISPVTTKKWVTVLRLAYGIPDAEVAYALSQYGEVVKVKSETHMAVNSGVRSVLMDITTPIPSQMRIRGHMCLIFYRGQTRTCFKCGKSGHQKSDCPTAKQGNEHGWSNDKRDNPWARKSDEGHPQGDGSSAGGDRPQGDDPSQVGDPPRGGDPSPDGGPPSGVGPPPGRLPPAGVVLRLRMGQL